MYRTRTTKADECWIKSTTNYDNYSNAILHYYLGTYTVSRSRVKVKIARVNNRRKRTTRTRRSLYPNNNDSNFIVYLLNQSAIVDGKIGSSRTSVNIYPVHWSGSEGRQRHKDCTLIPWDSVAFLDSFLFFFLGLGRMFCM